LSKTTLSHSISAILVFLFAGGCGRVGPPHPPFIRIPQPVTDLTAQQVAYNAVLSWTNPIHYIDGSNATDLAMARIFRNGVPLAPIAVTGPGQRQSYSVPVPDNAIGAPLAFAIQIETQRGKRSELSTSTPFIAGLVPGPPRSPAATVDQNQIRLTWQPPDRNASLAKIYIVQRSDGPSHTTNETRFVDDEFEPNMNYTYTITAATDASIPGIASEPLKVEAKDMTKPQPPSGLEITAMDNSAFLTWTENTEADVTGYFIYRSDRQNGDFVRLNPKTPRAVNEYVDENYRAGFYYAVSAVDASGNESDKSAPIGAP
jgi:hypothetical protein